MIIDLITFAFLALIWTAIIYAHRRQDRRFRELDPDLRMHLMVMHVSRRQR